MADLLTQHLKSKSESHSALQSLFSQWDFDCKLIPKALQTVGNLFPHYSRHDESHSRQILVNIERLLGDNIALLTATDTWLLLEAAYWHDIGMVVPQCDIEQALAHKDFDSFLQVFVSQPHHELHTIAKTLKAKSASFQIFFDGAPLDAVTRFRELMAEWFRQKHPVRAEKIVNAPHHSVGISSPRTELIPARLFGVLGRICSMHGASFDTLMGPGGLSFREAGMARDDCHPRFVACLLRLGDLLDLDDNRFCPVMQGIAGQDRPALSKAHEDKHAAIRHLRIDQERISIEAECQTVDGYLEAFRWFGWLKDEVQAQMSQWRDIVPSRELGLLPMLGPVSVRLAGNLKVLKNGERPAFTLDTQKAIELLQGNNLYESEYACIRELLQNSVDATLLKIWMTHREKIGDSTWSSPDEIAVKQIFENESIRVELTESTGNSTDAGETSRWTLTIQDFGTGISLNDLQHMLQIGGSQRNTARRREIDGMPEWMKPSGTFGIGFQSIFMLCDQVSMRTKSLITNETLEVTMYSPTGPHEGLVVLHQLDSNVSEPTGTILKLSFECRKFPESWSIPHSDDGSIVFKLVDSLDPLLDDNFPYTAAQLADSVSDFCQNSIIRIEGALKTLNGSYPVGRKKIENYSDMDADRWRFVKSKSTDVLAKIRYYPIFSRHRFGGFQAYYRGQKFDAKNISFPNVNVDIDLMSGTAGAWLNFSRDKLSATARKNLQAVAIACLEEAVSADITAWKAGKPSWAFQKDNLPETSFFVESMALQFGGAWRQHAESLDNAWLDLVWGNSDKKFSELFERDEWVLALVDSFHQDPVGEFHVAVREDSSFQLDIFAAEWMSRSNKSIQILGNPDVFNKSSDTWSQIENFSDRVRGREAKQFLLRPRYRFASEQVPPYDHAAFATALDRIMTSWHGNQRVIAHLDGRFGALALKSDLRLHARHLFDISAVSNSYVLLPFLFIGSIRDNKIQVEANNEQLDRLCYWVQNKLQQPADVIEIRRLYDELISWIDNEVMGKTIFAESWRQARGIFG